MAVGVELQLYLCILPKILTYTVDNFEACVHFNLIPLGLEQLPASYLVIVLFNMINQARVLMICLLATMAAAQNTTRGNRNCEMLANVNGQQFVYNSGCCGKPANTADSCPEEFFNEAVANIDTSTEELKASEILINGPRYITYDIAALIGSGGEGSNAAQTAASAGTPIQYNFTNLAMEVKSVLDVPLKALYGVEDYEETLSGRSTNFTYLKGKEVYELVNPEGVAYRMFAFAPLAQPNLTMKDLPTLGETFVKLPEGWKYQVRVLDASDSLISQGAACIVTDEIGDQYQKTAGCEVPASFFPPPPSAGPKPATAPAPSSGAFKLTAFVALTTAMCAFVAV
ncbi:hypothetical protein Ndes2437A_g04337 [Nannochloris sp. 'desiccata']